MMSVKMKREYRRRFRCWQRQGHGTLSMSDALKESCDVYLYDLVAGEQGLGHEETIAVARRFGLGEQLCMDLIGETPGTVPDETYKLQKYGDGWRTGDSINHSIGQGFWETTPLQLATMISRLVNGGYAVSLLCAAQCSVRLAPNRYRRGKLDAHSCRYGKCYARPQRYGLQSTD